MSQKFQIFARLAKFDAETGTFEAVAADETLDKAREVFDYESSKPYFQKWADEFAKNTNGQSVGNVRSMHGKNAAGKLTSMTFDDEHKQIIVSGKVVDDRDALKMSEGVYTGVSIGGDYVKRWDDDVHKGAKRYTADPCEVSLVDNPCNPSARFMCKAAGADPVEKPLVGDPEAVAAREAEEAEKAAVDKLAKYLDGGKVKPSAIVALLETGTPLEALREAAVAKANTAAADALATKRAALKAALANPDITNGDIAQLAKEWGVTDGEPDTVIAGLFKAGGFTPAELKELETAQPVEKRDFSQSERDKAADTGAAMPDGSYPIKSKQDLKNAIQAIGRAKNPDAVKRHIKRRAKALGAEDLIPDTWKGAEGELVKEVEAVRKDLYTVGWLARMLQELCCMADAVEYEAMMEGDGSELPARLGAACDELGQILCEMVEEETQEEAEKAVSRETLHKALEKYGARHSSADKGRLQKIHDHAVEMGADCGAGKGQNGNLSKLFDGAVGDDLEKLIKTAVEKAAKYDKMPIRKGVIRAIAREDSLADSRTENTSKDGKVTAEVVDNARKAKAGDLAAHVWLLEKGFKSEAIESLAVTKLEN